MAAEGALFSTSTSILELRQTFRDTGVTPVALYLLPDRTSQLVPRGTSKATYSPTCSALRLNYIPPRSSLSFTPYSGGPTPMSTQMRSRTFACLGRQFAASRQHH